MKESRSKSTYLRKVASSGFIVACTMLDEGKDPRKVKIDEVVKRLEARAEFALGKQAFILRK